MWKEIEELKNLILFSHVLIFIVDIFQFYKKIPIYLNGTYNI
jgi:hypothetical protein